MMPRHERQNGRDGQCEQGGADAAALRNRVEERQLRQAIAVLIVPGEQATQGGKRDQNARDPPVRSSQGYPEARQGEKAEAGEPL
jgi:hypothetical protein